MPSPEITREATELLDGALRKVAMTVFHARELARVLAQEGPYEISMQAHFEGVLYSGIAAEAKLAHALALLGGSDANANTSRLVRHLRQDEETEELGQRIGAWLTTSENGTTLASEARTLRNAATHSFYDKRGGEQGEWHYEVRTSQGIRGGLVLELTDAYARHLDELRLVIETVAERWELRLMPIPAEA